MIPLNRWVVYCLMTAALVAAVLLRGGVYPQQWVWCGLGVSAAAILVLATRKNGAPSDPVGLTAMGILVAWMVFHLIPLPPYLIARLTPEHWQAVVAARTATGQSPATWIALSAAPSATIERLLDVIPAMAALLVVREMAWWWRDRCWIVVAPVVAVGFMESLLGLAQFYVARADGATNSVAGTYVNRNHFSGLLEMTLPVAVVLAIAIWRRGTRQSSRAEFSLSAGPAMRIALLLAISACVLAGVVLSQSRMGFISVLIAGALTMLIVLVSGRTDESERTPRQAWRWLVPVILPLLVLIFLPTRELVLRFADMTSTQELSKDDRVEIWHDTLQFIGAYKWTGSGLGAYEHGFYRHKTVAPVNTVDFAHNDYLQVLAELGIPGGLLVAVLAGWILARVLAVVLWRRGARNWENAVGLFAALVTIGLHSLADFNLYIPANALAFAWLSGVAASPGLRRSA